MILICNMHFYLHFISFSLNFMIAKCLIISVTRRIYLRYIFNVFTMLLFHRCFVFVMYSKMISSSSSSVQTSLIVSSRKFEVFKPSFKNCPKIASYIEHLKPSWCALFFMNWKKRNPFARWVIEFGYKYVANMSSISLFALSTDFWLYLCLGLAWTIFKPPHIKRLFYYRVDKLSTIVILQDTWRTKCTKYVQKLVSNCRCKLKCNWLKLEKFCKMILMYSNPFVLSVCLTAYQLNQLVLEFISLNAIGLTTKSFFVTFEFLRRGTHKLK